MGRRKSTSAEMLGEAVRRGRRQLGLSQMDLAKLAHVSRKHISSLENGANVTLDIVERVADVLELPEIHLRGVTLTTEIGVAGVEKIAAAVSRAIEELQGVRALIGPIRKSRGTPEVLRVDDSARFRALKKLPSPERDLLRHPPPDAPFAPARVVVEPAIDIPITGYVAAGAPLDLLTDGHGETRSVLESQAPEPGWQLLIARGESMVEFGINDGDAVYVEPRRGGVAGNGETVIGWLNDGLVIKKWERRNGKKWLISGNPDFKPRELTEDDTWDLQAIVRRCIPRIPKPIDFPKISGAKRGRR